MTKRWISLVLALVVLLLVSAFSGCESGSDPAAQTGSETITICVDSQIKKMASELFAGMKADGKTTKIRFFVLSDNDAVRSNQMQQIRTEIMAGAGPDGFLLYTPADKSYNLTLKKNVTLPDHVDTIRGEDLVPVNKDFLFPDLNAIVHKDYFYPLDDMISQSDVIDLNEFPPAVLNAGTSENGLVVLPLLYTFPVKALKSDEIDDPAFLRSFWNDSPSENEPNVRRAVFDFRFLSSSFSALFDYEKEELAFSREELEKPYRFSLLGDSSSSFTNYTALSQDRPMMDATLARTWPENINEYKIYPMRNETGGITASITLSLAINANSSHAQEVFSYFEYFFREEVVTGVGFQKNERQRCCEKFYQSENCPPGILAQGGIQRKGCSSDETYQAVCDLLDEITWARFYSDIDYYMVDLHSPELASYLFGDQTEEEFSEAMDNLYHTLKTMLDEA